MKPSLKLIDDGPAAQRDDSLQHELERVEPLVDPVWTQIASLAEGRAHVRVLFTSPSNQAGTSLITAACGAALARNMRAQVLVVETHMRQPAAAGYCGVEGRPGFSDVLLGHASVEDVTREVPGVPDLFLLPGGSPRPAIAGEFASRNALDHFQRLATTGRFVLFDAPPLTSNPEARGLLSFVDAAVVVLRARASLKREAETLTKLIDKSGVPILGGVLNRHQPDFPLLAR